MHTIEFKFGFCQMPGFRRCRQI